MPKAGSSADQHTAARLDISGQSFYGKNAHNRKVDIRVNAQTKTHAEADVFQQAKDAGLSGQRATLYVDRELCASCGDFGGVGSLLRGTNIKEVVVVTPRGKYLVTADRPSVPRPID
jgi:deoxycytidylate deaminase